ncbi:winged helix-turn-helix domain-containing protein [Methylorubrum extorquens]|uniref:winged helix-turn-helix domain-containing protein n=1 Tax=Methylorubrum extorquens TaxID=408 RepID=UPI000158F2F5|nr:winged helix-turn-helix domain-containing protein [Methylorubrum extorquens]ABY30274.1 conserved hypothetical protein [Methylorubrum extorquens PA1]KQP93675.1 hypothetical protein ASF55_20470 [Methylobacterium sp. Leaf119]WIU41575.1 winged helix-turn-helix domain-containing protein [Methylorubrum extorquens]
MSNLDTFAKVRALHDRTTNPGEKAAAASRMEALAHSAGMTITEAVSKLDAPKAPPAVPRNIFEDLFNTPEFRAQRAERQREYAERRIAALAEYGSEDAVWEPSDREHALEAACRPVIVRKPIINGEMDTLQGWEGGRWGQLPPAAQAAVSSAYAPPASVHEAWAEFRFWEKLADDRVAFFEHHDHDARVRGRISFVEHLLDTMPARSMGDLRARLDWMQHLHDRRWSRGDPEDGELLATLRADIERMGPRLRDQDAAAVQDGQSEGPAQGADPLRSPDWARASLDVQDGHSQGGSPREYPSRRTNANKRRDVIALLDAEDPGIAPLTNREIARRVGVSPTTVGTIRRMRSSGLMTGRC